MGAKKFKTHLEDALNNIELQYMHRCSSLEMDVLAPTITEIPLFTGCVSLKKAFLLHTTPPHIRQPVLRTIPGPVSLESVFLDPVGLPKLCSHHACASCVHAPWLLSSDCSHLPTFMQREQVWRIPLIRCGLEVKKYFEIKACKIYSNMYKTIL